MDYEPEEQIHFAEELPGFPDERDFLILPFAGSEKNMLCLQSVATPVLAFVLLDPFSLCPEYMPELTEEELKALEVESMEELVFYVLSTLRTPVETSTVNLRCPLAINPHTLQARQIIMDAERYSMRSPLSSFRGGGDRC